MLNLIEISKNIALKAKKLQEQCLSQSPKPLTIPAQALKKQKPEFAKLPSELTIFQMLAREDDSYKVSTIAVYQKNGAVVVASPDLEIRDDFKIVKWKTGLGGRVVLKHKSGIELIAAIASSPEHLSQLEVDDVNFLEGEGEPPIEYLKPIPSPETPLYSPILPHNVSLEVIATGKKTREFETPMVDLQDSDGKVYRDVITNSDLQQLILDHGIGVKFEILGVHDYYKNGDKSKRYHRVDILRIGSDDFSDLEI